MIFERSLGIKKLSYKRKLNVAMGYACQLDYYTSTVPLTYKAVRYLLLYATHRFH